MLRALALVLLLPALGWGEDHPDAVFAELQAERLPIQDPKCPPGQRFDYSLNYCKAVEGAEIPLPEPELPPLPPLPDPWDATLAGGRLVSFSDSESPNDWTARFEGDGPLVLGGWDKARIFTRLDLTLESNQGLSQLDALKALEFEAGAEHRISKSSAGIIGKQQVTSSLYFAGGFGAIRSSTAGLRSASPSWWEAGLKASVREEGKLKARLRVGIAADQRLNGEWQPCLNISGAAELPLADGSKLKGMLVGEAIRSLKRAESGPSWQVRLGLLLAI